MRWKRALLGIGLALALSAPVSAKVAPDKMKGLGGQLQSDLAVATYSAGPGQFRVGVFGRGMDNRLWWTEADKDGNWSGWNPVQNGLINAAPSCLDHTAAKKLTCYVRGLDNAYWSASRPYGGQWGGFAQVGMAGGESAPQAVYYRQDGLGHAQFLFWRSGDKLMGRLVEYWSQGPAVSPTTIDPRAPQVVATGIEGEPSCFTPGVNKGIQCVFKQKKVGTMGWTYLRNAHFLNIDSSGGNYASAESVPKEPLQLDTLRRVGAAVSGGRTFVFMRGEGGSFRVVNRDGNGIWTPDMELLGAPESGIGCARVLSSSMSSGVWCAFLTSNKGGAAMFFKDDKLAPKG